MTIWQSIASALAGLFRAPPGATVAEGPRVSRNSNNSSSVSVSAIGDTQTEPDWLAILRAAGFADPDKWAEAVAPAARRRGIHAGRRAAAFAATIAHESDGGRVLTENLNYSTAGLLKTWPSRFSQRDADMLGRRLGQEADQRGIAERAYSGRMGNEPEGSGDGWKYRGRGLIQLTGRDAYAEAAKATGLPLVQSPDLAIDPDNAAEIAAWTWAVWKGCNQLADAGQVEPWRRAINGGLNGLEDVRARYQRALAAQ